MSEKLKLNIQEPMEYIEEIMDHIEEIIQNPKIMSFIVSNGLAGGVTYIVRYTDTPEAAVMAAGNLANTVIESGVLSDLAGGGGGAAVSALMAAR